MSSCLTDRQACDGWRQVCLMEHGRSQIPVSPLIEPTEGGLCCGKVPQSGSEEAPVFPQVKGKNRASRGNNVYVLDFKRFLPVRKSRCKGMFFCLEDLTDSFLFFLPLFFFSSIFSSSWCRDGVTEFGSPSSQHTEGVWAKYACRSLPSVLLGILFQMYHVGKVCFLTASDTLKFLQWNIYI